MISGRYAWGIAALLFVAAVPVVRHVYVGVEAAPPGGLEAELPDRLGAYDRPEPGGRQPDWVAETFGASNFVSRRYGGIDFFAARTTDWKRVVHLPELALTDGLARTAERRVVVGGLPVRVSEFGTPRGVRVAASLLLCDGAVVESPFAFIAGSIPRLFVAPRAPMTLLHAQADTERAGVPALEARLVELVAAAAGELPR